MRFSRNADGCSLANLQEFDLGPRQDVPDEHFGVPEEHFGVPHKDFGRDGCALVLPSLPGSPQSVRMGYTYPASLRIALFHLSAGSACGPLGAAASPTSCPSSPKDSSSASSPRSKLSPGPNARAGQAAAKALVELTDEQFLRVVKAEADPPGKHARSDINRSRRTSSKSPTPGFDSRRLHHK